MFKVWYYVSKNVFFFEKQCVTPGFCIAHLNTLLNIPDGRWFTDKNIF